MSKFNKIISKQKQERKHQIEVPVDEGVSIDANDLSPVQRRAVAGSQHGITLKRIEISLIDPSPYQPRFMQASDSDELQELADNIRQNGQINPILVRPKNGRYELVGGERRLKAIRDILKLKDIDCLIKDISDEKAAITALVDNINRADLTDYEIALALQKSCISFGYPIDKVDFITEKFNISRNKYYRLISLFDLPDILKEELALQPMLLSGSGASLLKTAMNKATELIGFPASIEILKKYWQEYILEFQLNKKRHTQFIKSFEEDAYLIYQQEYLGKADIIAVEEKVELDDENTLPVLDLQGQHMSLLNKKGQKFGSLKCTDSIKGNKVISIRFNTKVMTDEKLAQLKALLQDFE